MKRVRSADDSVSAKGSSGKHKRSRWRPIAWATAALMSIGLAAGFATAASAATAPNPAAGVAPGATSISTTNYVFYTASDGSVWQKVAGSTNAATGAGGILVAAPSPIYNSATGNIMVFGEGTDHALWVTNCTPGSFCSPWVSLGGVLSSKPGAVQSGTTATSQSVYVRGSDGTMWGRDNTATGWGPWHFVNGRLLSGTGPSATFDGTNQQVLAVGTDHQLYLLRVGGPGFAPAGGRTNSSPAITLSTALVGYARGADTASAGWFENLTTLAGWNTLGGFLTSGFGATAANSVAFGYALGGDGQVWQNRATDPAQWSTVTP
jgi:hypothetical protein